MADVLCLACSGELGSDLVCISITCRKKHYKLLDLRDINEGETVSPSLAASPTTTVSNKSCAQASQSDSGSQAESNDKPAKFGRLKRLKTSLDLAD